MSHFYKLPKNQHLPKISNQSALWTELKSLDLIIQALMGSTALPILFPPYLNTYFDGGVLLNQPISPAVILGEDIGVQNYFVVIPSSERLGSISNLATIAETLVGTWLSLSLINQIDNIKLRNQIRDWTSGNKIRVCLIRPSCDITEEHGVTLLSFGQNVPELIAAGEKAASDRLDNFYFDQERSWY